MWVHQHFPFILGGWECLSCAWLLLGTSSSNRNQGLQLQNLSLHRELAPLHSSPAYSALPVAPGLQTCVFSLWLFVSHPGSPTSLSLQQITCSSIATATYLLELATTAGRLKAGILKTSTLTPQPIPSDPKARLLFLFFMKER